MHFLKRLLTFKVKKQTQQNNKRAYEAALPTKSIVWLNGNTIDKHDSEDQFDTLRERARNLVRNNAYAESAVSTIANNVIGTGIVHDFKQEHIDHIWHNWSESTNADATGTLPYYALQSLIMREVIESGECFVQKIYDQNTTPPIKLKVIPSERLDHQKNIENPDGITTSNGIEYDIHGLKIAYYIKSGRDGLINIRVPASEMIHVFNKKRASQRRGVTSFAPVLLDLKVLDNYEAAELKRKEINSAITGFLEDRDDLLPENAIFKDKDDSTIFERIKSGTIIKLPSSKQIKFTTPQSDGNYDSYTSSILRKISSGLKVPYELLTGDLSRVNFSSARMGFLEFQRSIEIYRWHMIIPQLCTQVSKWFLDACELIGVNTSEAKKVEYTAPHREFVDPLKETNAMIKAIRSGLKTYPEALREYGFNPKKVKQEINESNKILDDLNIVLDCDPRKTTQQGNIQIITKLKKEKEKIDV